MARRLALLAFPLLLAACGTSAGAAPATSSAPATPPAALVARLLTVSDLPSGYTVARPYAKLKYTYDPAACAKVIQVGAVPSSPHLAVVEFENRATKSRLIENLYRIDDPETYLKALAARLNTCLDYRITDPYGRLTTIAGRFTTEPTRTDAFVLQLAATGAITLDETLVGRPAGRALSSSLSPARHRPTAGKSRTSRRRP